LLRLKARGVASPSDQAAPQGDGCIDRKLKATIPQKLPCLSSNYHAPVSRTLVCVCHVDGRSGTHGDYAQRKIDVEIQVMGRFYFR